MILRKNAVFPQCGIILLTVTTALLYSCVNMESIFNGENASLLTNTTAPTCDVFDDVLENFKLHYPLLIAMGNENIQESINNQIFDFLTNYCQSYVKSSEFFLNYKVTHLNSKLLSF
jgi:hypothetical protein